MSEQRFVWQVPSSHPAFAGHFPGNPILPGVVLLDRVAYLVHTQVCGGYAKAGVAAWTVSQAKFLSPVGPGEALSFVLAPDARGGWRFAVQGADGRAVASGCLGAQPA